MGCGSSKTVDTPEPPPRAKSRQPTRSGTAGPPSQSLPVSQRATRLGSQKGKVPGSRSGSGTESSSGKPHRSSSRSGTAHGRSSKPSSRHGTSGGPKRRDNTRPDAIPEETVHAQPAEDAAIIFDFGTLRAYIRSHVLNYYRSEDTVVVSRTIAQKILELIFARRSAELKTLPAALLMELQPYMKDPSQNGANHLAALCNSGAGLVQSIHSNPAKWTLGTWEHPGRLVIYPSIFRNGQEVVQSEVA